MRNRWVLIILAMLLPLAPAARAEVCTPSPLSDPEVAGRASSVSFPDGRTVTIISHDHGERDLPARLQKIAQDFAAGGTIQELERSLNERLKKNVDGLRDQKLNYQFLQRRLSQKHNLQFIAKEVDPFMFQNGQLFMLELRDTFEKAFRDRSVAPPPQLSSLQLVAEEASSHLAFNEPDLFQGVVMFGAESKAASDAFDLAYTAAGVAFERVSALAADDAKVKQTLAEGRHELFIMAMNRQSKLVESRLIARLENRLPKRFHELGHQWIAAELKRYAAHEKRDEAAAKNLANRRQTGLHFVGAFHFNSLIEKLQHHCEIERRAR